MSTPLVSVVMAVYDGEKFVGEAVRSVLGQTYPHWELLVVDDGSRDRTVEIVGAFADERIRILSAGHVGVLGQVRNRGIEAARGEAVALIDADDVWLPAKLERQLRCLDRPEVGVVHTAADLLVAERQPGPRLSRGAPLVRRLLEENFVYSSSALVRRALLEEHGAFDPDPALGGSPDYDLWLRLAPHTEFAFVEEVLLFYRVHGEQMSGRRAIHESALVALDKLRLRDPGLVASEAAAFAFALGKRRQLAGLPGKGRRELLGALWRRPLYSLAWRWLLRSFVRPV
jgi:glycosyltransferase involved in cell wall biosynthesis